MKPTGRKRNKTAAMLTAIEQSDYGKRRRINRGTGAEEASDSAAEKEPADDVSRVDGDCDGRNAEGHNVEGEGQGPTRVDKGTGDGNCLDAPDDEEAAKKSANTGDDAAVVEDSVAADDSAAGDEKQTKTKEKWDLKGIFKPSEIMSDNPTRCMSKQGGKRCCLVACCTWYDERFPNVPWHTCLDCQEDDFRGWPEGKLPIDVLSDELRAAIADKCTDYEDPEFPNLPSYRPIEVEHMDVFQRGRDLAERLAAGRLKPVDDDGSVQYYGYDSNKDDPRPKLCTLKVEDLVVYYPWEGVQWDDARLSQHGTVTHIRKQRKAMIRLEGFDSLHPPHQSIMAFRYDEGTGTLMDVSKRFLKLSRIECVPGALGRDVYRSDGDRLSGILLAGQAQLNRSLAEDNLPRVSLGILQSSQPDNRALRKKAMGRIVQKIRENNRILSQLKKDDDNDGSASMGASRDADDDDDFVDAPVNPPRNDYDDAPVDALPDDDDDAPVDAPRDDVRNDAPRNDAPQNEGDNATIDASRDVGDNVRNDAPNEGDNATIDALRNACNTVRNDAPRDDVRNDAPRNDAPRNEGDNATIDAPRNEGDNATIDALRNVGNPVQNDAPRNEGDDALIEALRDVGDNVRNDAPRNEGDNATIDALRNVGNPVRNDAPRNEGDDALIEAPRDVGDNVRNDAPRNGLNEVSGTPRGRLAPPAMAKSPPETIVDTSILPSPFRAKMMGVPHRSLDDWFDSEVVENVKGKDEILHNFKTVGSYSVNIDVEDGQTLISSSVTQDLQLYNVQWKSCGDERQRSYVLREVLRKAKPTPLEMKFGNATVLNKYKKSEVVVSNRKSKSIGHDCAAYIRGTCQARDCPAEWVCGFTKESLIDLNHGLLGGGVELQLIVLKNCRHYKDESYGQLRGRERADLIASLLPSKEKNGGPTTYVRPKTLMENEAEKMSSAQKIAKNYGGHAVKPTTAYNFNRDVVKGLRAAYGLPGTSDMFDLSRAARLIRMKDLTQRGEMSDPSKDCLGILRDSIIGNDCDASHKESTGIRVPLYGKTNVELGHYLAKSGKASFRYDGTACEVNMHVDLNEGELMQHHIMSVGSNVYTVQDKANIVPTKVGSKILSQFFGNRSATPDHKFFFQGWVDMERRIFGKVYPPLFFCTDNADQYANAALEVWLPASGKAVPKPLYANLALHFLLEIERNGYEKQSCSANIERLLKLVPFLINLCKCHTIRDAKKWSSSTKRKPVHRMLVNQYTRMLMHLFCHSAGEWKLSEAIVQMGLLVFICSEDTIECKDLCGKGDPVSREHSDPAKMAEIGANVRTFIESQMQRLESLVEGKLDDLIQSEQSVPKSNLVYKARALVEGVVAEAKRVKLEYAHCYFRSVNEKNEAVIRVSVAHGIDRAKLAIDANDEYADDLRPKLKKGMDVETYQYIASSREISQYVGGAEVKVALGSTTAISNPYKNTELVDYCIKEWAGKLPMTCGSIVKAGSIARDVKVEDNSQGAEGVFRWLAEDNDFKNHLGDLALYMNYTYDKLVANDRLYALQVSTLESSVKKSNDLRRKRASAVSADMQQEAAEDAKDTPFGKAGWATHDSNLRARILKAFHYHSSPPVMYMNAQHARLEKYAKEQFQISFVKGSQYNEWLNDNRRWRTDKRLPDDSLKVMDAYATSLGVADELVVQEKADGVVEQARNNTAAV